MKRIFLCLFVLLIFPSIVSATQVTYERIDNDEVELTLQLVDANGALVTTGGSNIEIVVPFFVDVSNVTDNGDGSYSVTLSSDSASTSPVSAIIDGVEADVGSVTFIPGLPAPVFTTFQQVYNSNGVITVRVIFADGNFNRIKKGGLDVEFYSELNSTIIQTVIDHEDGTYDVTMVTDESIETIDWGVSLSVIIRGFHRFLSGFFFQPRSNRDGVLGSIAVLENASESIKLEFTLFQEGEPLETANPDVRTFVSGGPQSDPVIDEGGGTYTVIINGEVGDVGGVSFEVDGATTAFTVVEFRDENAVEPPIADIETISNSDGSITLNMTMLDQDGSPITFGGYEVIVSASGQTNVGEVTDNQDGTYTTQLTSASGGSSEISLEVNGVQPRVVQSVSFANSTGANSNNGDSSTGGGGFLGFPFLLFLLFCVTSSRKWWVVSDSNARPSH